MYLFFDTETTGIPRDYTAPVTDLENWPRLVQIAWGLYDNERNLVEETVWLVKPEGFEIPVRASEVHHITTERATEYGLPLRDVLGRFSIPLRQALVVVGHNLSYDVSIVGAEFLRCEMENLLPAKKKVCTMRSSTNFCKIPGPYGNKWPRLNELYAILFSENLEGAHDALVDIKATARCYFELEKREVIRL